MKMEHGVFADAAPDALSPGAVRDWTGDPIWGSKTIPEGYRQTWDAPICERCWVFQRGYRQPARSVMDDADELRGGSQVCAFCGRPTWARIWTRANPHDVPYPALEPTGGSRS